MRLRASVLKAELGVAALEWNLLRYTQMLRAMTGRTGTCNKLHSLDQQLARWLLTMKDYADENL
jgi:hypothetical protein